METNENKYLIPFREITFAKNNYTLETEGGTFALTTATGEYYILGNLADTVKRDGQLLAAIGEQKGKPALLPIAIVTKQDTRHAGSPPAITRIAWNEDETDTHAAPPGPALLEPFRTKPGQPYNGGFIDPSRTTLTQKEPHQLDTAVRMVEAGMGITIVPEYALSGLKARVNTCKLDFMDQRSTVSCYYRKDNDNVVLKNFLDIMDR